MVTALFTLTLLAPPQLSYASGAFVIKDGKERKTVPLSAAKPPVPFRAEKLSLRLGKTLVTFDQRGLGIRYGSKGGFTHLAYIPTNPKVFGTEEIKKNYALFATKERSANVSAVSGFEVVKDKLFLLLRWEDKAKQPWLETLVSIDSSAKAPKVDLIGRFGGVSFAKGPVCDELYSSGTKLYAPLRGPEGLGFGTCDVAKGVAEFKKLGPIVDDCRSFGGRFYTVSKAPYGMKSVGVVDPVSETFRAVLETRGEVVPSALTSALVVKEGGHSSLFAFVSGAKLPVEDTAGYAQTPYGVLVWSPKEKPERAELREADGWKSLAKWVKPPPPKKKPVKKKRRGGGRR